MEAPVSEQSNSSSKTVGSRVGSTVAGLAMNKHGLSMNTLRSHRPQQVYVALPPPLGSSNNNKSNCNNSDNSNNSNNLNHNYSNSNSNNNNNNNNNIPIRKHSLDSKTIERASLTISSLVSHDRMPAGCLLSSCRTIVFAASTLHHIIQRCLLTETTYGHKSALSFLVPLLQQLQSAYDQLDAVTSRYLTTQHEETPARLLINTLIPLVTHCTTALKRICSQLHGRINDLARVLDNSLLRHLLLAIHGVTLDMKDVWQVMTAASSAAAVTSNITANNFSRDNNESNNCTSELSASPTFVRSFTSQPSSGDSPLSSPLATRSRSHSDHITPTLSLTPLTPSSVSSLSSSTAIHLNSSDSQNTTSALYTHLKMAVTASLRLVDVLNQAMDSMLRDIPPSSLSTSTSSPSSSSPLQHGLTEKLAVLQQRIQQAITCTRQLNHHIDTIQEIGVTSPQTYTIQFWEDTNMFLKTFVSLMNLIRSLSTEEDVTWPKPVKQGCLHVTRVTTEIAKLWNSNPTFVQDGYYLGKAGDDTLSSTLNSAVTTSPATAEMTGSLSVTPNANNAVNTSSSFLNIPIPP